MVQLRGDSTDVQGSGWSFIQGFELPFCILHRDPVLPASLQEGETLFPGGDSHPSWNHSSCFSPRTGHRGAWEAPELILGWPQLSPTRTNAAWWHHLIPPPIRDRRSRFSHLQKPFPRENLDVDAHTTTTTGELGYTAAQIKVKFYQIAWSAIL